MSRKLVTSQRALFWWLPNALSASRVVLAVPIYTYAAQAEWTVAFWLLIIALITDFFDGLAAKKLHSMSSIGGHIDRVADFSLAAAGLLGLTMGTNAIPLWFLCGAGIISLGIGYVKFCLPADGTVARITAVVSLSLLFGSWISIVWAFAALAFGWSWVYAPITLILLAGAARLKKHRLQAWFGWLRLRGFWFRGKKA